MSVLNPGQNGPPSVGLSNNSVNKLPQISETFSSVILTPIPLVSKSQNAG